jgi:hypothetical protein
MPAKLCQFGLERERKEGTLWAQIFLPNISLLANIKFNGLENSAKTYNIFVAALNKARSNEIDEKKNSFKPTEINLLFCLQQMDGSLNPNLQNIFFKL